MFCRQFPSAAISGLQPRIIAVGDTNENMASAYFNRGFAYYDGQVNMDPACGRLHGDDTACVRAIPRHTTIVASPLSD